MVTLNENLDAGRFGVRDSAFGKVVSSPISPHPPESMEQFRGVEDSLAQYLPDEDRGGLEWFLGEVPHLVSGVFPTLPDHAASLVFSAATNDVLAVVRHSNELDGRSAALRARILFEHLINMCDLLETGDNDSARYLAHKWVVLSDIAGRRAHLQVLEGKEHSKEVTRLDRLKRRSAPRVTAAIDKYGNGFKRGWARGTLRDRATRYALEDEYVGYKILSSVVHGSSGSLFGINRELSGRAVHRTGFDLELVAPAWWEGITAYHELSARLNSKVPAWELEQLMQACESLLRSWPNVKSALQKIDATIWPSLEGAGPAGVAESPIAAVRLFPTKVRWYYYRPSDDTVIAAHDPDPSEAISRITVGLRAVFETFAGGKYAEGSPLIPLPAVKVIPKNGAQAQRAAPIFVPVHEWDSFLAAIAPVLSPSKR